MLLTATGEHFCSGFDIVARNRAANPGGGGTGSGGSRPRAGGRPLAAASPATEFCITLTDHDGIAIGHGCARTMAWRSSRSSRGAAFTAPAALAARLNLTIRHTDLQNLTSPTGPAGRDSPWTLAPRGDDHGPPGGYGTWTLTIPGGRQLAVRLEQVPTFDCDHARESRGHQPGDALRHLVQVRDGECTLPVCTRHARECDFEHAIPYHKGGRTCACNAGARSRKCHRIKQSKGWNVTQPKPGFHQWTTPTGRVYTQEPMSSSLTAPGSSSSR